MVKLLKRHKNLINEVYNLHKSIIETYKEGGEDDLPTSSLLDGQLDDLNNYIDTLYHYFETRWKTNLKTITRERSFGIYVTDCAFLVHELLYELLMLHFGTKAPRKIKKTLTLEQKAPFVWITLSYNQFIVSLYESRKNYMEGKELIGDVLFRHAMELFESSVLSLFDDEYFKTIKQVPANEDDARARWRKIRPEKVKAKLYQYLDKYMDDDDEFREGIKIIRNVLYHNYSKSSHADFHSVFAKNFKIGDEDGEKPYSPFDIDKKSFDDYIKHFIIYNYGMIIVLFVAFISHNSLPFNHFGRIGREVGAVFKLFESLMKSYLGTIKDKEMFNR